MKKIHILGAAVMALAMTACDNEPQVRPGSNENTAIAGKYVAINIANTDAFSGRAEGDVTEDNGYLPENAPAYIVGEDFENKIDVDNLRFYFFYSNGEPFMMESANNINSESVASNMIKPVDLTAVNINNGPVTGTNAAQQAVLILGKPSQTVDGTTTTYPYEGSVPSRVVCIANASTEQLESYANISMTDLRAKTVASVRNADDGNFIMSSSAYWTANGRQFWSQIGAANIQDTPQDALKAPVQIYIERAAARVQVSAFPSEYDLVKDADNNDEDLTLSYYAWDSSNNTLAEVKDVKVAAKVIGWGLSTVNEISRVIKNIKDFTTGETENFFSKTSDWSVGVRSFWATSTLTPNDTPTFTPEETLINGTGVKSAQYIAANIFDPFLQGSTQQGNDNFRGNINFARSFATKVLVGVKFFFADAEGNVQKDENGEPVEMKLMKWAGAYYTPEALCHVVGASAQKTDVGYARVKTAGANKAGDMHQHFCVNFYAPVAEQADSWTWGYSFDEAERNAPDANLVSNIEPAMFWNGMGYYIINISNKIYATNMENQEMFGVVRNHVYDYTLDGFVGLGTPVPCPHKPTMVENPSEGETYVAARLNILNWRLVSHKVTLQ